MAKDMVAWLEANGCVVRLVRQDGIYMQDLMQKREVAFVAIRAVGATVLHWVLVKRVVDNRRLVELSDVRRGRVTEKQAPFLRSCESPFWVVRRRDDGDPGKRTQPDRCERAS